MSFVAPFWLLVALSAAIILALHSLRRTRIEVPSVLLWRQLSGSNRARPVRRLPKFNWLLALQILAVLLIALALARPFWGASTEPAHHIYVLDVSGSMTATDTGDGRSRFEHAVNAIGADVAALDPTANIRLSLLTLGAEAESVAARFTDSEAFRLVLSDVVPTHAVASPLGLPALIAGVRRQDEVTQIRLYTDGEVPAALSDIDLVGSTFGASNTPNAGVTGQLARGEGAGQWSVTGTVVLSHDARVDAVGIWFRPEGGASFLDMGAATLKTPVEQQAGLALAEFAAGVTLPGPGVLQLVLPEDAAIFDNVFSLAVAPEGPKLRALYIGLGNRPIELALSVNPAVELFTAQDLPVDVDDYDLVLVDNVALPRVPRTNIVWLGSARGPDQAVPDFDPSSRVLGWSSEHALTSGMSWQALEALPTYAFAPMPDARALLVTDAGNAIEARTTPFGREVRLALGFGGAAWVNGEQLPLLMNRILDWTGGLSASAAQCIVGEVCRLPARDLSQPILDAQGNQAWALPVLGTATVPDTVTDSFTPTHAGLYGTGSGRVIAVNPPVEESDVTATPGALVDTPATPPLELWRWLLLAGMAILLLEAAIVGLGDERFLYPSALGRGVPGANRRRWLLGTRVLSILAAGLAFFVVPLPSVARSGDYVTIDTVRAQDCSWIGAPANGRVTTGVVPLIAGDVGCGSRPSDTDSEPLGVNLEAAARLAAAMLRPDTDGRLLLKASAAETVDDIGRALPLLSALGVPVDVHTMSPAALEEGAVVITQLQAPSPIFAGDSVPLTATLYSASNARADLQLIADGDVVEQREVELLAGWNRLDFGVPEVAAGEHVFQVALDQERSGIGQEQVALTVLAAPLVAIVTPDAKWGDYLAAALDVHGLRSDVLRPDRAPFRLDQWLNYDSVVLLNTPAIDLGTVQQQQLEEYVRLHGGGLLILGGENTFGPGGYFRTALEDLSPLSARVPNDLPVVALAFVLDRSGSMQAQVEGVSRLDIAKQATLSAVKLLNDESQVSVVVFDTEPHVIAPMRSKNIPLLEAALAPLQPGGGTFFMPALDEALRELDIAQAPVRHIILMSDGLSQPGDYDGFAARAQGAGITMSVVAIGSGADVGRLGAIARNGGGAFHSTTDFRALPSILSQEAMMLSGEPMQPGVQPAIWIDQSARFLAGLPNDMPPVQGFVETTAKPDATVHMETVDEAGERVPLLASWSYGNGNVLAFATHGAGPGTAQWLGLESYPLLWSQAIRHFAHSADTGPQLKLVRQGDMIHVTLDDTDATTAAITRDGSLYLDVPLRLQADGTRDGQFFAAPGMYEARLEAAGETMSDRLVVSYPAALDPTRSVTPLAALAAATGGRLLNANDPEPQAGYAIGMERVWRPWVVLALLLFLADLCMRYAPGYFSFLRDRRQARS